MNQPDAHPAPNYVSCPCQHCSGKIEFDANQLVPVENTTVPCPHCKLETTIFVPEQKLPEYYMELLEKYFSSSPGKVERLTDSQILQAAKELHKIGHNDIAAKALEKAANLGNSEAQCMLAFFT